MAFVIVGTVLLAIVAGPMWALLALALFWLAAISE